MDISDEDIAKLVLGYLKSEKCKSAAKMFLHSSRHLEDVQNNIRRSKHFITHKHGYCLGEILREYAKLYTIILEYMEDICYTSDVTTRDMPNKLVYLIETTKSKHPESYTPSLSPRSRSSTPAKQPQTSKQFPSQNLTRIDEKSSAECDVNTTPLHDLPGHFSSNNTSAEKQKSTEESDVTDNNDNEGSIAKVLVETVLEDREFQEKLAENINSVIQKPSDENVVENNAVINELDSAIKAIVNKTEHDPVFERLLCDLIGPERKLETESDQNKQKEKTNQETFQPEENLNKRSIITLEGTKVDIPPKQNLTVNTNTGDVILYDGTLENYIKEQPMNSHSTSTSTCSSNLVLNTGLLMVQPQSVVQQPPPVYVWNGSQIVNMGVPQYKINTLSEQDILTMPTIIVSDENQQPKNKGVEEIKVLKKIAPKVNTPTVTASKKKKPRRKSPRKYSHSPKTSKVIQEKVEIKIEVLREPQTNEVIQDKVDIKSSPNKAINETTPTNKLLEESTSTPRSGSHVRVLDFDFTPKSVSKQVKKDQKQQSGSSAKRKSPKVNHQPTKISKSLFGSPGKKQRKKSGDNEKKGVKKSWDADLRVLAGSTTIKNSPQKKEKPKRKPKKSDNLNKTEIDAKSIEDNLKELSGEVANKEEIGTVKTQEPTMDEKKILSDCTEILIEKQTETEEESENTFTLINYNRAPRIKRKCNIDGNVKKVGKVTKVKEVKNLDVCNNKMILSPSKLNASKRTFVEKIDGNDKIEKEIEKVEDLKVPLTPRVFDENYHENDILTLNFSKSTPLNVSTLAFSDNLDMSGVMKATRNLIPLLETPLKMDNTLLIPKTPGLNTPNNIKETPITKMINNECEDVDLIDIETPKISITPSIGITPYVSRRTDYSTSSSYYQPSDTEQNKSLEQLIEETKKEKTVSKKLIEDKESNITTSITNKIHNFNRNIIAKKNLSLVSKTDTISFGDSESDNDFNDNTFSDDESLWESKKDVTVIHKEEGKSRYPLRSRNKDDLKKIEYEKIKNNDLELEKGDIIDSNIQVLDSKDQILIELEKKRQETIAKIKKPESKSKSASKINLKKEIVKKPIKPKNNALTKKGCNQKKVNINKNVTKIINIVAEPERNDSNQINPLNFVETHLGNNSNDNKKEYESNQELLVRDLKERGIYLLPKNKKEIILDPPNDNSSTELITVEIKNDIPLRKVDNNKSLEIINNENKLLHDDLDLTDSLNDDKEVNEPIVFSDNLKLLDYIIFHDPTKPNDKSLKDYDLKCLEKTYNVPVYWEEYKFEDSRPLKVTKIDFFFDLESNTKIKTTEKVKILDDVTLQKKITPIEPLYTQVMKNKTTEIDNIHSNSSPLNNLYEDDYGLEKKRRRKSVEINKKPIPTKKSNRSESVDDVKIKGSKKKSVDLMDLAIVGDKTPRSDEANIKRKAEEDVASEKNKCPKMCDSILSGLNVEQFLSKIHKD